MKDPEFELPGLMTTIEKVYLKWMFDELKLSKIRGFLFSDNENMMKIHEKCGWKLKEVVPIEQKITNEGTRWEIIRSNESEYEITRYYNLIELTREDLMKNFNEIKYKIMCG
jgi:RimJ/RimL family protein N-acetyltransferase